MNGKLIKSNAIISFIVCYFAYTAIYIARVNLSIASPEFIERGILDATQIGLLGSIFAIACALGKLFNGQLNDRFLPHIMMSVGLFSVAFANIFSAFVHVFIVMAILWGINAYAQSMLWGAILRTVSTIYGAESSRKRIALMTTSVAIGNILGIVFNTWLITKFGIKYAYFVPGVIAFALYPVSYIVLKKVPVRPINAESHISFLDLLKQPGIRKMIVPSMIYGTLKDNVILWMALFFVYRFNIDLKATAYYIILIPLVGLAGRLTFNPIYDRLDKNEIRVTIWSFVICALCSLTLLMHWLIPIVAMGALSLIYASTSLMNISIVSVYPLRFNKTGNISSVSGLMDFFVYIGSGISTAIYGRVIDIWGYNMMFITWVVISGISIAIMIKNK